ncbi:MAG: DUF4258 domain-containing protein [Rhodospirillales bacterium]|nr:DUF4258 domain-containing protein [Rhodospirillales bacterium]
MSNLTITNHASRRLQQRGMKQADIDFILTQGTEVDAEKIMLTDRDARRVIKGLKEPRAGLGIKKRKLMIATAERLRGKAIIIADGRVITAYHNTRRRPIRHQRSR